MPRQMPKIFVSAARALIYKSNPRAESSAMPAPKEPTPGRISLSHPSKAAGTPETSARSPMASSAFCTERRFPAP